MLDLLLAAAHQGMIDGDDRRTALLAALQAAEGRLQGEDERMQENRLTFLVHIRSLPTGEALAELERALFGEGDENWPRALEAIEVLGDMDDEKAGLLLARRLEKEQQRNSDMAHRLREARAKVDLRKKLGALNSEWDRALLLYGAIVATQHSIEASELDCEVLALLEQQRSTAAIAFLKQIVVDPAQNPTLRQEATAALLRLQG